MLSGAAVKVFLELRTRFHGANNGKLILSLEEAAALLGLGKATVLRALQELQDKGLVVCTRKGQWYGRLASTWAVTDQRIDGVGATHDWRKWRPGKPRLSVLKWTQKTNRGSGLKPSAHMTGPLQNRDLSDGTNSEPVTSLQAFGLGSRMDR